MIDCRKPEPHRLVGPTRPWHFQDDLRNDLRLTRPYPYKMAGQVTNVTSYDVNIDLIGRSYSTDVLPEDEAKIFTDAIRSVQLSTNHSFEIEQGLQKIISNEDKIDSSIMIRCHLYAGADEGGFLDSIRNKVSIALNDGTKFQYAQFSVSFTNRTITQTLHIPHPNPYSKFCEYGCVLFYSSQSHPMHISECFNRCDNYYAYNFSVGYNDYVEVARLECRDGCQIALRRCQAGYYCSQLEFLPDSAELNQTSGFMEHCPAGTFRSNDYESVIHCIPCPPGRFREAIKGRRLEDCTKCPAGTYNEKIGSRTIHDCLRCPAGTFTNEPGSEKCICITPDACKENQFPSPGDAEKRDTVPFIGRW